MAFANNTVAHKQLGMGGIRGDEVRYVIQRPAHELARAVRFGMLPNAHVARRPLALAQFSANGRRL